MKVLIINTANASQVKRGFEKETRRGVSETVPNESLTIRDIVDRYIKTGGTPVGKIKNPHYYDGDFDSPDLEKVKDLDHFDLQEFREGLAEHSLAIEAELTRQAKETEQRSKEDAEALEAFKKERQKAKSKAKIVKKDVADEGGKDQ